MYDMCTYCTVQSDRFPAALNSAMAEAGRRGREVQGVPHLEHDARHHDSAVRYLLVGYLAPAADCALGDIYIYIYIACTLAASVHTCMTDWLTECGLLY